jgi:SdrD B-like domain/FlgD Ig-like domain
VYDFCATAQINIDTAWDAVQGKLMAPGDFDNEWLVVKDPVSTTAEPRPAYVLTYPGDVAAYAPGVIKDKGHVVFEYRFCLDNQQAFLNAYINASNYPDPVYLNGHLLSPDQMQQTHYTTTPFDFGLFNVGENVLSVNIDNSSSTYGNPYATLSVSGTILGSAAHYRACCTGGSGVVTGQVWLDSNGNGKRDGAEYGSGGWGIQLWQDTSLLQTKVTDYFGRYYFMDVMPGTYHVDVVPKFAEEFTTPHSQTRLLTRGATANHVDFGYKKVPPIDVGRLFTIAPNPFNPETTMSFMLSEKTPVSLRIYGVNGDLVRTVIDGELTPGEHRRVWDGRDDSGRQVASGVYFGKLVTGTTSQTVKMVLLK